MAIEKDARANQGFKWKEAKNLAKIGHNIKANDDGTVALGSIEKIGYIAPEGYTLVENVGSEQDVHIFTSGLMYGSVVLGQMYQYEKIGEWEEVERDTLPPEFQSLTLLAPGVSTEYSVIAFYDNAQDGTTKCWKTKNSQAHLKASFYNGFQVPNSIMGSIKVYDAGGFKPFFTQQQYQDILNIIK